jgi:predicted NUDIX family phosphoesterase
MRRFEMSTKTPNHGPAIDLKERATALGDLLRRHARRAFIVELAGTPKAGKSTSVQMIRQFFEACGFRVHVLKERAAECPLPMKGHFFFNSWTTCSMIAEVLATVDTDTDLLILDRGFFDALMWLELQLRRGQVTADEARTFSDFVLLDRWRRLVDLTIVMEVAPEIAIQRENQHRLLHRTGSIMSPDVLNELNQVLSDVCSAQQQHFELARVPSANNLIVDNKKLVELLLDRMTEWSDPCVVVVPRGALTSLPEAATGDTTVRSWTGASGESVLATLLESCTPMRRSEAEQTKDFVQLVACALPLRSHQPFLLARTPRDQKAQQYGRYTLWKGCHLESDVSPPSVEELLAAAKRQLKTRIEEDFHLAIEAKMTFHGLVWNSKDSSDADKENHAALLFKLPIDSPDVSRNMEQKEFKRQGRFEKLSGKFRDRAALVGEAGLEPWSKEFLRTFGDST